MAKRILLADDSITIQKVVELTFSDGDYEVTAVNNGNKAIQKLSEMRPDIILSDIIMPEKNGYEVCEFVKSHPEYRTIPVILLTGTFEPFDPDRADKAGCDAVVTKPFESQSLIHKVEELIEGAKSQPSNAPAAEAPFAAEPAPPPPSEFATGTFQPQGSVFGGPTTTPTKTTEMPMEQPPAGGGETRAFPKMTFDELPTPPPPAASPSPWDEPAPETGATRAFPKMSFEDLSKPVTPPSAPPPSPWDEPAPESGATRAFPKMSFEDLQKPVEPAAPPSPPPSPPEATAPLPWDSRPSSSFDTTPPPEPAASSSLWDEKPAGETRTFPKMSFDELEKMASEAPPMPAAPAPIAAAPPPPEPEPATAIAPAPAPAPEPAAAATESATGELTEEQIDRIARRVVQLISEQVVRHIAWAVIPDLAENVVKERIRQLESE